MAKILLVDDDPDQLEIRTLIMETEHHDVATARNRGQAVEVFARHNPDLVLMDLRLPRTRDGLDLIDDLRRLSASVPILVLSGWPDELRDHPELPLVNHVLRKPVRTQSLLALIQRITA